MALQVLAVTNTASDFSGGLQSDVELNERNQSQIAEYESDGKNGAGEAAMEKLPMKQHAFPILILIATGGLAIVGRRRKSQ